MIILVTGTPGSGKTLYTVSELLNKQFKDRPLYINGIPDLLLPHEPMEDEDVLNWFDGRVPVNSVIVIDEVQRVWRPRAASGKAPQSVTELETHRHKGIDFVIITQHPQQMDAHVRRLVGRHIHVRRTWGLRAAVVYEWDSCSSLSNIKTAQSKVWRYNKKAFALYKSSEKHTKAGGRVPFVVWVLIVTVLALPFFGWDTMQRMLKRYGSQGQETAAAPGAGKLPAAIPGMAPVRSPAREPMTPQEYVAQYQPRVAGLMHTAPIYDGMTSPKVVPIPAACIQSKRASWVKQHGGTCGCYTQTGTPYDTTQDMCVKFVRNEVFFPFLEGDKPQDRPQVVQKPAQAAETLQVKGEPQFPLSTFAAPVVVAQVNPNTAKDVEARHAMRNASLAK